MPTNLSDSTKGAILTVLLVIGVVVFLFVFHFLLGMTWMIYVLVIAVVILIFVRKMVARKTHKASATAGQS